MNGFQRTPSIPKIGVQEEQGITMKRIFFLGAAFILLLPLISGLSTRAQTQSEPAESPVAEVRSFSDSDLDILLGPIALYPDPLLAVLLPAATRPAEIVMAVRVLNNNRDLHEVDAGPWSD